MSISEDDSTSLEELFHAAADHLGQLVTADPTSVPDQVKLQLYGLYKQATAGPCSAQQPPFWNRAARLKWDHWHKLGAMPAQTAMAEYIEVLTNHDPGWQQSAAAAAGAAAGTSTSGGAGRHNHSGAGGGGGGGGGGVGGPVFSTMRNAAAEQQQGDEQAQHGITLHELAGKGDTAALQTLLRGGSGSGSGSRPPAVDSRDESGCTALHFAADRGQLDVIRLLLAAGADFDAVDNEGQTPLHYAAMCEQQEACKLLLVRGANSSIQDADGQTAAHIGPQGWNFWSKC